MSDNEKVVMGLKETKEAVDFTVTLGMAVDASLEDGKISFSDAALFLPAFLKLLPAIEGADQIPVEFKLATQEEIDELKLYLKDRLDLRDDQMEAFIEDAFGLILTIWSLVRTYFIKTPASEEAADVEPTLSEAPAED